MYRSIFVLTIVLFGMITPNSTIAQESDAVLGIWLTGSKDGKVEIYKCGDKYCGKIVWIKEPNEEDGTPKIDDENPDEALQNRPIMGLKIMNGFEYDEDFVWEDGEIYDPDNGKTYSCEMTLSQDKKSLEVRGYIGFTWIGRSETWLRTKL